ncbi:MAG: hypothetical protein U0T84_04635 [Chitinophagales bacterium]
MPLQAQNHYWAQQFGATATLTGGAVIASCRDNTAMYYNPGLMGFIENPKISVSANLYELNMVNLRNVAGSGLDARSTRILFYPQFIGGSFVVKKVPKLKIYYGTFIRNRSSVRYNISHETRYDVIPGAPGDELYKARLEYDMNAIETWFGLGFGYRINDVVSVGGSMFGSYLNLEYRTALETNADALQVDTSKITPYTAASNDITSFRLDHVSAVFKLGIGLDFKRVRVGLAVTLPSATIWGRGSLFRTIEGYNLNIYATDTHAIFRYPSFLVSDEQKNLKAQYKTVPSFALGATYNFNDLKVDFSAEYFLGIPSYDVVRGADVAAVRPVDAYGGQPVKNFMLIRSGTRPVFNVALGFTYRIRNKIKLLTGFHTDFNNRMNFFPVSSGLNSLQPSYWHLMHFALGAAYNRGSNDISIGFTYAFGLAADRHGVTNFVSPQQDLWLRGTPTEGMKTYVNNIGLVIGYTYYFRGNTRSSERSDEKVLDW